MKSFREILSEVAQPRSEDEKHFKDKHIVAKKKHPVAPDEVFTGGIKKAPKRIADYDAGEDELVYEASAFDVPTAAGGEYDSEDSHKKYKKGNKSVPLRKESRMDPVGQEDDDINNDGKVDAADRYLHRRRRAISKAIKKETMDTSDMGDWYDKKYPSKKKIKKEEVEQIDEISDKKLDAYRQKAFADQPAGDDGSDKYRKRKFGRDLAFAKQTGRAKVRATKEEVEQIDEISKKTLGSYVAKASSAAASDAAKYGQQGSSEKGLEHFRKAYSRLHNIKKAAARLAKEEADLDEAVNYDNMTTAELKAAAAAAIRRGDRNAVKAITAAANKRIANKGGTPVTKLTTDPKKLDALKKQLHAIKKEEVEQLDELSPNTPYSCKAKSSLSEVTRSAVKKTITYVDDKGHSRTRNIPIKRVDRDEHGQEKIRESFLDEAFKAGMIKLKDGGSVILKKEDADLLNKMFRDLSSTNRKKMEEVAMKNKSGFDEILGFAREVL